MYNGAFPCSTDKGVCLWKVAALNSHQFWKSVLGGKKSTLSTNYKTNFLCSAASLFFQTRISLGRNLGLCWYLIAPNESHPSVYSQHQNELDNKNWMLLMPSPTFALKPVFATSFCVVVACNPHQLHSILGTLCESRHGIEFCQWGYITAESSQELCQSKVMC